MAIQRTVSGSYQQPVEGVVDFEAFERGFQKGMAPGLAFKLEEETKQKELDDLSKQIKLNTDVEVFQGINKNDMTGGVDLKTNTLFQDDAVVAMSEFRPQYIQAFKANDQKTMSNILSEIGNIKTSYSNLADYVQRINDYELNDGAVSDTRFIDENGNKIELNSRDFTLVNNNNPQNTRQGSKKNKYGQIRQGFYITKGGKQFFINTQDMDQSYLDRNFKLKANQQDDIVASVSTNGIAKNFNRIPTYDIIDNKRVIRQDFYDKAESFATLFANTEYSGQNDPIFESAWNQFTSDEKFVSNIQDVGDYKDRKIAAQIPDETKLAMLKDYATEKWKITVANAGYVEGDDGRAQRKDILRETTEDPGDPRLTQAEINRIKRQANITNRAKDRVDSILSNPVLAAISTEGLSKDNVKQDPNNSKIIIIQGSDGELKFNMNRKEDVAKFAKILEQQEFGSDQTTDAVKVAIDEYIEKRRKVNNDYNE